MNAKKARLIVENVGSAKELFDKEHFFHITKAPEKVREKALEKGEQLLDQHQKAKFQSIFFDDPCYPKLLKDCEDHPFVLHVSGSNKIPTRNIAIVGSRKTSKYGKDFTQHIVNALSKYKINVVSGMAHGIDRFAHEAALQNNCNTSAILGHGLDQCYPVHHHKLKRLIEENGQCISEHFFGEPAMPYHFPKRNRIVAGMSEATIVVEAASKGGALVTANLAHSYQRELFAVPGRSSDQQSQGCNRIIKEQKALLLDDPYEIPSILGWEQFNPNKQQNRNKNLIDLFRNHQLSPVEQQICQLLCDVDFAHFSTLQNIINQTGESPSSILLSMELKGIIEVVAGQQYRLISFV